MRGRLRGSLASEQALVGMEAPSPQSWGKWARNGIMNGSGTLVNCVQDGVEGIEDGWVVALSQHSHVITALRAVKNPFSFSFTSPTVLR